MGTSIRLHQYFVLLLLNALVIAGCSQKPEPALILDQSVAPDLGQVALATWQQFTSAFSGQLACIDDVTLVTSKELGSRATYDPTTATITVQVPATAAILQSALVHEWAHHVEYQCEPDQDFRAAFLVAQGLPATADWYKGATWEAIPSEQFAEAAVAVVLGKRQIPTEVDLSSATVDLVAEWASSSPE